MLVELNSQDYLWQPVTVKSLNTPQQPKQANKWCYIYITEEY